MSRNTIESYRKKEIYMRAFENNLKFILSHSILSDICYDLYKKKIVRECPGCVR